MSVIVDGKVKLTYRETGSHHEEVRLELPGLEATVDLTRVW